MPHTTVCTVYVVFVKNDIFFFFFIFYFLKSKLTKKTKAWQSGGHSVRVESGLVRLARSDVSCLCTYGDLYSMITYRYVHRCQFV